MRRPWQMREQVQLLPNKLHTGKLPWCRDARLVWVDGTGALRWEDRGWMEDGAWERWYLSCLTLRGTPLLSRKGPGCPTCASLLATGWGPADCPELETVRETLNGGFTRLEDAVSALAPLLLDGHHKAAAAARLGRAVPCLTILPLESYEMKPGRLPRTAVRDKAGFGPFTVPVAELPAKWLPKQPGQHPQGRPEWRWAVWRTGNGPPNTEPPGQDILL